MATIIRSELSRKNKYWIERHRYLELKHFCLQYPIWKKAYEALDGLSKRPLDLEVFVHSGQMKSSPTEKCAESKIYFSDRMKLVEEAAINANPELCNYVLRAVTEGLSYNTLRMMYNIPCCRDVYYESYRKFFWLLNQTRN